MVQTNKGEWITWNQIMNHKKEILRKYAVINKKGEISALTRKNRIEFNGNLQNQKQEKGNA